MVPHESGDLDYVGTDALALNGATVRDAAGNDAVLTLPVPGAAGSLSINKDIVIDTVAPVAPNAPDLRASSDMGTSSMDNVTDDTTPTFDITGVESGATVTLTLVPIGGGEPIVVQGQVVAGGSSCAITVASPLSPGVYTVTARQTDLAGNAGSTSAAMAPSLVIDNVAPAAPLGPDLQATSDTGAYSTDNITDVTTPTFDIAGLESGSSVTLTLVPVGGGDPVAATGTVIAGGSTCTITVTSPLSPGTYTVTARQTDLAGNVSDASAAMAPSLVIDNVAPAPLAPDLQATERYGGLQY